MPYIGKEPVRGQNRELDDISGSFNGGNTAFTMQVGGVNTSAGSVNQLFISVGGVMQNPGTDFTVASSTITFTTPPASGLDFWGLIQGDAVDINTPADGSVTAAKLASGAGIAVLTGSTNNTVTTVTGAGAIQGEANLTFDGTTLKTTASTDAQLKITAGNASSQSRLLFEDSAAVDATITYDHNDRLLHIGAGTSTPTDGDLVIDSNGQVQIGATAPITTYSSGGNKLTVYKADGNGGVLELGGSTNLNAYNAGTIIFYNNDNANNTAWQSDSKLVGIIRAETITTDSNAGDDSGADITFYTKPEAEAGALAMTIHGERYVTTPNQPCCMYTGLSNSHTNNATDSTETLVFATVKRNEGSHYNGSNGRFTAPVAGTYFVGVNLLIDDDASTASRSADLQKNGSGYCTLTYDRNGGEYRGMSGTGIIELAVGDYISIRATAGVHIGNETSIVVYLLG